LLIEILNEIENKVRMLKKLPFLLLIFGFLLGSGIAKGQGEVCIPQTFVGKKVKGVIYLNTGDSVSGKFIHLTPRNDYYTTHILFKDSSGQQKVVNRADIISYYDKVEKEKRYKVYTSVDSVFVKKSCHFDMGVFMVAVEDGPYKLLLDVLSSTSSIQAYNESESDLIYYLLPPNNKLLKLNRVDIIPQLKSLFSGYPGTDEIFSDPGFTIDNASEIIRLVNTSISNSG